VIIYANYDNLLAQALAEYDPHAGVGRAVVILQLFGFPRAALDNAARALQAILNARDPSRSWTVEVKS
jgi:hypothetical protein